VTEEEAKKEQEAQAGVSKQFVMSVDGQEPGQDEIKDKYKHSENIQIKPQEDGDDERDETTKRREDFLNIYKEDKEDGKGDDETPDLSNGIKFKRDEEEEDKFDLKTSKDNEKKPLIQELDSKENTAIQAR